MRLSGSILKTLENPHMYPRHARVITFLYMGGESGESSPPHHIKGAYRVAKKSGHFGCKSNGTVIFGENLFGNCRLPPEILLFSRSERNGGNFFTICYIFQFPVSHQPKTITRNRIANGKRHLVQLVFWFWKNSSTVIPTGLL